ncbi:uncharacterized protein JCM15063_001538 [Sporobolomyces koalae]|uniref:uncharacterized protein n=1 Tax=Sporobolomyces koalae TaxID=500713 RepID=UPI00317E5461
MSSEDPRKRSRFSWWTPSIPLVERNLSIATSTSIFLTLYRLWRLSYLAATTPAHLGCIVLSSPPINLQFGSIFHPEWSAVQKLVYPILRRLIWALADVGDPNVLTRSTREGDVPWWALALEESTVRIGRGRRVHYEKETIEIPQRAWVNGWITGDVLDDAGPVDPKHVNLFWFETSDAAGHTASLRSARDRYRPRNPHERIVMYLFGGGFVCGSPGEGSRCFKIARETGLRVVGVNYRRATSVDQAFPAALQDALAGYFHLTLDLGFEDVVLAGDSAGGGLALNVVQYLTRTLDLPAHGTRRDEPGLVLPSALLMFSPWCDLTLNEFPLEPNTTDIILPSICHNSVQAYLASVKQRRLQQPRRRRAGSACDSDLDRLKDPASHAWLSPSLESSLAALRSISRAYSVRQTQLRVLISMGTGELFYPSIVSLVRNLHAVADVDASKSNSSTSGSNERTRLLSSQRNDSESHSYHIPNNHARPSPLPSPLVLATSISNDDPADVPSHSIAPSAPSTRTRNNDDDHADVERQDDIDRSSGQHDKPTYLASFKHLVFGGWLNIMLIAVPLSFVSHFAKWGSTADFIISFIAIVPLASLLGDATEQCALRLGQTVGGLLNATFGNAVELIVGILALLRGELRIVQTSLLGSILSNLLLVLGCSFLAGGVKFKEQKFQMTAAQASSSLMVLGCSTLIIPAAFHASQLDGSLSRDGSTSGAMTILDEAAKKGKDLAQLLTLSRGTAIILIVCYACYLYFQLSSHAYLFEAEEEQEEEEAKMNISAAIISLVAVTVVTSFCADYLVGAIDEFAQDYSIPKAFIGLILLPIVGNAAEHVTSVWMAAKGKMEITIGVAIGSSIQIAVGVIPALVIVAWIVGQPLTLFFENFETIILFVSVLLVDLLVSDGTSHWLEGVMLVALYLIIGLAFWVA